MKVFHLFIDDTFVFYDAYGVHLEHLSCGFMWFKAMFGLRINMEKSELIPIGDVTNVEDLASVLGCKIGNLSSTYLSLTLGAPHKFVRVWESIEEKFQIVKGASRLRVVRRHPLAPCLKAGDAPSRRRSPLASHNVVHRCASIPYLLLLRRQVVEGEIECLWGELGAIKGLWNGLWCVAGDFNAILSPEEHNRGGSLNSDMRRFSEVIEDLELKDLPLLGCVLLRPVSDHFPILLDGGGLRRDPSPFRFENMWLKLEGFKDLLKSWWEGDNFSGSSSFILVEKLKVLKSKLKEWNKDIFGRVEYMKDLALDQVEFWDAKEKTSRLSLEELEARKEAREEYQKWMANAHKRRNNVGKIRINGVWLSEENEIKEGIVNAFRSLLFNLGDWRPPLFGLQCETLENMDACALEVSFTEEGVFGALLGCNGDKAPGPDGFSMAFWQFAWDFVKDDVMSFFRDFYEYGAFVEGKQILDAVLIANEAINSVLKNNENGILCKLDIEKAYDNVDWVKGRSEKGVQISHLLFADDALVFCQASQDHLTYLSWLLMWFEAVSGLRLNLEKSELISVGRVENIDDLALDFGCRVGSLPSTYLGLPLGALFKSVTVWDGVEERFHRSSIRRRLEQIQRDFLWGGGNLEQKPHLVRWELVCLKALWNQVIRGKYGEDRGDWCSQEVREAHGVGALERAFNDWEAERFLERLHGKRVLGDVEDMVFWTEIKSGKFSPKISFFAWEATWGKALTLDLVQKRGWTLANRCFMCLEKEETIDRLLLHC
ncbi:hypothetical protein CK203_070193 [Vitis vinifera]|uniref:Reverse transcriptase zinc-binding domain-containing protein n=1 Tax=Vitis vinifera TaxID=29760 RepID=A0A438EHH6_VITVI|nr:hypothetical protein CK203_070193 [Vitis vinifera]